MAWVFDASIAMAWCFVDEKTPDTDKLLHRLNLDPAIVPSLWHLEIANVLTQAMRTKKRLTHSERSEFLETMARAKIEVDTQTSLQAWTATLNIADQYVLSAYDAAYLELALRLGIELATLDQELRAAAKKAGVKVIPRYPPTPAHSAAISQTSPAGWPARASKYPTPAPATPAPPPAAPPAPAAAPQNPPPS
jgi:predicted nucleic acid-binding protein